MYCRTRHLLAGLFGISPYSLVMALKILRLSAHGFIDQTHSYFVATAQCSTAVFERQAGTIYSILKHQYARIITSTYILPRPEFLNLVSLDVPESTLLDIRQDRRSRLIYTGSSSGNCDSHGLKTKMDSAFTRTNP